MVSLYLGEDAFLGSHEIGTYAQFRFSSCKGFLLPPHPQVISPVSRKRFARSSAGSLQSYDLAAFLGTDLAWHAVQAHTGMCRDTAPGMTRFEPMGHAS